MNAEHYNELIDLSQKIYEYAADTLTNYCSAKYCGVGNDTTEQQMEDHLIVAEEVSAYLLGNMLAMLTKESQEDEIKLFEENLRRVIAHQTKKASGVIIPRTEIHSSAIQIHPSAYQSSLHFSRTSDLRSCHTASLTNEASSGFRQSRGCKATSVPVPDSFCEKVDSLARNAGSEKTDHRGF